MTATFLRHRLEETMKKEDLKMKKQSIWMLLCLCLAVSLLLGGCGKKEGNTGNEGNEGNTELDGTEGSEGADTDNESTASGRVFYLNFKPEASKLWEELAKEYTAETGVEMKVQTAASGTYEQTLKSEIAKKDAPNLFQINGPDRKSVV